VAASVLVLGGGGGGVKTGPLPLLPPPPQADRNTNIIGKVRRQLTVDEIEIISLPLIIAKSILHRVCFVDISRLI
jgi:hypothetical protein